MVYTNNCFEWDDAKARANALKHFIRFEEATEASDWRDGRGTLDRRDFHAQAGAIEQTDQREASEPGREVPI